MASAEDVVRLLTSIDASLKALVAAAPKPPPLVADASDLDGQYGDPEIKVRDPREWRGESQVGKRFSQCPPEYLDLVASRLDYFADKAEKDGALTANGKPVGPFNRREAARARGWAARLRNGWTPPTMQVGQRYVVQGNNSIFGDDAPPFTMPGPKPPTFTDDDIPF